MYHKKLCIDNGAVPALEHLFGSNQEKLRNKVCCLIDFGEILFIFLFFFYFYFCWVLGYFNSNLGFVWGCCKVLIIYQYFVSFVVIIIINNVNDEEHFNNDARVYIL